jgi:hypothetical protein
LIVADVLVTLVAVTPVITGGGGVVVVNVKFAEVVDCPVAPADITA